VTNVSWSRTAKLLLLTTAAGTVVSAYLHFYLYFEGGYRVLRRSFLGYGLARIALLPVR
jgi:hypothetical protein